MTVDYRGLETLPAQSERLYSPQELEQVLDTMAAEINQTLAGEDPVLVLVVMNGGLVTAGKLLPRLSFLADLDYVHASRYGKDTEGGRLSWQHKPIGSLAGRRVLLLDDILDRGITLKALVEYAYHEGAASVHTAALVQKQLPGPPAIEADFVGLMVPDRFVFGFGMDVRGYWRNAPGIFAAPEGV